MGRSKIHLDVGRILQLYRQGYSTRDIAKFVHVSHDTVLRRLREAGQEMRTWRLPGEK